MEPPVKSSVWIFQRLMLQLSREYVRLSEDCVRFSKEYVRLSEDCVRLSKEYVRLSEFYVRFPRL